MRHNWLKMVEKLLGGIVCVLGLAAAASPVGAAVVVNEIFYHAPEDIEDLEFVELHNTANEEVDLQGWAFTKGIQYKFEPGTKIGPGGYLVLARSKERFEQYFNSKAAGVFEQKLSNDGERIELTSVDGKVVDSVRYRDSVPWPTGADGYSGSLERICPDESGEVAENWASSPLSADRMKPTGSPGAKNTNFSEKLPPIIKGVKLAEFAQAGQPIAVQAEVEGSAREVKLLYKTAGPGFQKEEETVAMEETAPGRFAATIPGQEAGKLIRVRVRVTGANAASRVFPGENEPRPALTAYVPEEVVPGQIPFGWIIQPQASNAGSAFRSEPPAWQRRRSRRQASEETQSFDSAFIYFDPGTKKYQLFDFIQVASRPGGQKVKLHRDKALEGMTTINLTFENEMAVLAEPLAYELYRRVGMSSPLSYHIRLWVNGRPLGYQLLFEQPNKGFLRRNNIREDGNMYKLLWYGGSVVGQHEKKTNKQGDHEDIIRIISVLNKTEGDQQWQVIEKHFEVDQVANYFAVNMILSHWDGFFNNYFTYHDVKGSGKWTMYPWDQDQTWGIVAGGHHLFHDLPLTFGMNGDIPPGERRAPPRGEFQFGRGAMWWRPPGFFSGPLLANPEFRKRYLARIKEILETVYTEENFGPVINSLGLKLREEVKFRAESFGQDPSWAVQALGERLDIFHDHLRERRKFLLDQREMKAVGKAR